MYPRALTLGGCVLLSCAALWAGVRLYSSRTPPAAATSLSVPAGTASPPLPSDLAEDFESAGPAPAKIPDRLPTFALRDKYNKLTSIQAWPGKSLIINFWATWCAPCRREIPLLKSLSEEWAGRNVLVIGVAVDHRDQVLAYAAEFKIPYSILIGEQDALDAAAAFGVDTPVFPFTVFTDRRGEVVALYLGELHKPQADLILSTVEALNRDQLQLPEARRTIATGLGTLTHFPAG